MNNVELLKTYHFPNKIRCGSPNDGGYVIANLDDEAYDCYISAGISTDESFSRDFILKYNFNEYNSFAFDGTISTFPCINYTNNTSYIHKNIGCVNNDNITNLDYIFKKYNNVFLKMDIEGGEWEWLTYMNSENLGKFKQLVFEFHGMTYSSFHGMTLNSFNSTCDYKMKCLEKLNKTHYLIHAHGSNCDRVEQRIPNIIELTYLNKNCFHTTPQLNQQPLPIVNLDSSNDILYPDVDLNFYPFVNPK